MAASKYARWMLLGLLASGAARAATTELLRDVGAKAVSASSSPLWLGAAGGRGYFAATQFNGSPRLYRTDGTPASTVAVTTSDALFYPRDGAQIAGRVLFLGSRDNSRIHNDLWVSNGTDAGTVRLADLGNLNANLAWLGQDDTRGYFCHADFTAVCALYVTDGTASGTRRIFNDRVVHTSIQPLLLEGELYFLSAAAGTTQDGLWVSDGTLAGTRQLLALSASSLTSVNVLLHVSGGVAWVGGADAQGSGVFSLNLASGATSRLTSVTNGISDRGVHLGGLQLFIKDFDLWRTDGTAAGTYVLTNSDRFNGVRGPFAVLGGRVLFSQYDNFTGGEIWVTDGSVAGTQMLVDATPGSGGYARLLTATGSRAFFMAGDAAGAGPVRFWVTDGTGAGTRVIPLRGGGSYTLPLVGGGEPTGALAQDRVYFNVMHLRSIPNGTQFYPRLFTTDFTGTDVVDSGGSGPGIVANNHWLFTSYTDTAGLEPWASDGANSQRLADIAVSGQTSNGEVRDFTTVGNQTYFVADDGDHGRELWVTDGTTAGTRLLKDIFPGNLASYPGGLHAVGSLLYFNATEPGGVSGFTRRLWRSDGTEAGTFSLGDALALAGGGSSFGCASWITEYNGRAWFLAGNASTTAHELWSTDGTAAGTRSEFELPAQVRTGPICELRTTTNGLIFIVDRPTASELWGSNGTLAGTARLGTVQPALSGGSSGFIRADVTVVNGVAYLLADGGDGYEPWRTNGTAAGTVQVQDLQPGAEGAQNFTATAFGDGIVFSYGSQSGTADGLWRIPSATSGATRIKQGRVAGGRYPVGVGSQVFFLFEDAATQTESLWVTDGTAAGSRSVVSPSPGSTFPSNGRIAGDGLLYYYFISAGLGEQIWVTNGVPGAERRISNLADSTIPSGYNALLQGRPIFSFTDSITGNEPWIVRSAAPQTTADTGTVSAGANVLINVRANDSDADSSSADLAVSIVTAPAHGTAVVEGGSVRYTPTAGYTGSDTFQYRLSDELNTPSAPATVTVTVNAASGGGGGGGGSGGGGGGSLDLLLLGLLAGAAIGRSRFVLRH